MNSAPPGGVRRTFVDRDREREFFGHAFHAHRVAIGAWQRDPSDLEAPRQNIVDFYGQAGIGKTVLSRRIESWIHRSPVPPWPRHDDLRSPMVTLRIDLARGGANDLERLLLDLRIALAVLERPMHAFDLAFLRYWSLKHPHQPLGDFLRGRRMAAQAANALKLPEQLVSSVVQVGSQLSGLPGAAVSIITNAATGLAGAALRTGRQRELLTRCPPIHDVLEQDVTLESLSRYPSLLAWDLYPLQRRRSLGVVVFLDGFEDVGTRSDRQFERYVQRMVWLMPNVFFVISGRDRLEWAATHLDGQLDRIGPINWPGLAGPKRAAEHELGPLDDPDAEELMSLALEERGEGPMETAIRQRIISNAQGWPDVLRISVDRFVQLRALSQTVRPEDFDGGFPVLLQNLLRGLGGDERIVVRAASLLDSFDLSLVTAAAGLVREAPAFRLTDRSLVETTPGELWPYRLGHAVRINVRGADQGLEDSWTPNDWRAAATRAVAQMGLVFERAVRESDRQPLIACLNQGLRLAHEYELELGWLVDAAHVFVNDYIWESTLQPGVPGIGAFPPVVVSTTAQAVALALGAIAARQREPRSRTIAHLNHHLASPHLHGEARDLVAYFHAECQRDLARPEEAESEFRALTGSRRMSDAARKGVIHLQRRGGRFRESQQELKHLPIGPVSFRLTGDLAWTQGQMHLADLAYGRARNLAQARGLVGEAALSEACRAFANGFRSPQRALEVVASARVLLLSAFITWAELQVDNAELFAGAGSDPELAVRAQDVIERADRAGLSSCAAYAGLACAFDATIRRDRDALAVARSLVAGRADDHQFGYLVEIVDFWASDHTRPPREGAGTDWVDNRAATAARWRQLVTDRQMQALTQS